MRITLILVVGLSLLIGGCYSTSYQYTAYPVPQAPTQVVTPDADAMPGSQPPPVAATNSYSGPVSKTCGKRAYPKPVRCEVKKSKQLNVLKTGLIVGGVIVAIILLSGSGDEEADF